MNIHNFEWNERCHFGNLNLKIPENSKILILGPNGVGKTSFLREICFHKQHVEFESDFISSQSMYSSYQTTNSYLSVEESLKIIPLGDKKDFFQVSQFSKQALKNLSAGQLQRFWLHLAFNMQRKLLILDEPSVYLDYPSRKNLKFAIKNYPYNLFISSHEYEYFKDTMDYVLHLDFGTNSIYLMKDFEKQGILK